MFDILHYLMLQHSVAVVYFDQETGAPHAIRWSKSFVFALKQAFSYFSVTNRKKKQKRKESRTKTCNFPQELTSFWVSTSV